MSDFNDWLQRLTPEERQKLSEILKDDNTYLANSIEDVIAILQTIEPKPTTH